MQPTLVTSRAASRSSAATEPGRLPSRWWADPLIAGAGLVLGLIAFLPHRHAWIGHNGDHYYYAATALQYAGRGYEESLRIATAYFDYPYSATQLDLGYLNPAVAPLIYPRVALGLLALPFVGPLGIDGIWLPGWLCGAASLALLMVLTLRRVGRIGLLAVPVLIGVTRYAPEFMFGIYAEAPVILTTTLLLLAFPLGGGRRAWSHAIAAAALVPLMMLSRQVPLLPVGMVVGGFAWAWVSSRHVRNPWLPFLVTIVPTTVLSYGLLSRWAPYNALPFLYTQTETATPSALLAALPGMWSESIGTDWRDLVVTDLPMIVVAVLGLAGLVLVRRSPVAGVALGCLLSGSATLLLNGQPNDFRYLAPSLPVVLLLAALVLAWSVHQVPRLLGQRVRDWPGNSLCRAEPRHRPGVVVVLPDGRLRIARTERAEAADAARRGAAWAATAWLTVAGALTATVALHRPAPVESAAREQISAATLGATWPLGITDGTLLCSGPDYQIWFLAPGGERYAVSGTAMARSLWAPRVTDLAPERFEYAWPEIKPLLSEGMRLCGSHRSFQTETR